MSSQNYTTDNTRSFNDIIAAIEKRTFPIGDIKSRLLVLSVHPSVSSEGSDHEVLLRLALCSDRSLSLRERQSSEESRNRAYLEPGTTVESSLEARFSELGLSYSFQLYNEIDKEVNSLVQRVREDVPRALQQSETPRVVFIDPVNPGVKIVASIFSLLVPFLAVLYWTKSLARAAIVILLFVTASSIYKLITARFRLK